VLGRINMRTTTSLGQSRKVRASVPTRLGRTTC